VDVPALREIVPGRVAACHFAETLDLQGVIMRPPDPALI
jgi:hypothetical protein